MVVDFILAITSTEQMLLRGSSRLMFFRSLRQVCLDVNTRSKIKSGKNKDRFLVMQMYLQLVSQNWKNKSYPKFLHLISEMIIPVVIHPTRDQLSGSEGNKLRLNTFSRQTFRQQRQNGVSGTQPLQ